jgi:hypothetical protein
VKLRFFVDVQGRVADVHVLESRLGSIDVERCLVRLGRTIAFPRPQGGVQTSFEYSLEFRSSGAQPVVDLPDGALDQALAASLTEVTARCGPIVGEVTATLYVDPMGTVLSVGLASSGPLPEELATCLAHSLRRPLPPLTGASAISRGQVALHSWSPGRPASVSGTGQTERLRGIRSFSVGVNASQRAQWHCRLVTTDAFSRWN